MEKLIGEYSVVEIPEDVESCMISFAQSDYDLVCFKSGVVKWIDTVTSCEYIGISSEMKNPEIQEALTSKGLKGRYAILKTIK